MTDVERDALLAPDIDDEDEEQPGRAALTAGEARPPVYRDNADEEGIQLSDRTGAQKDSKGGKGGKKTGNEDLLDLHDDSLSYSDLPVEAEQTV